MVDHVIITGQSLAVQPSGTPLVANDRPTELTKFSGGLRTALGGNRYPELPFALRVDPASPGINVRTGAVSGQPYTGLKKGTTTYTANINNLSAAVPNYSIIVRALLIMHGEADDVFGTSRTQYRSYLLEWLSDYNSDCKAATGQSEDLIGIAHQCSSKNPSPASLALLDAHRAGEFVCVGPIYALLSGGNKDGVHPDAQHTFYLGEYHARAYEAALAGNVIDPVAPTAIERTGATITATFSVPTPPLVWDTTLYPSRTNKGFGVRKADDSMATINSVSITGSDEVTIVCSADPGDGAYLTYGPPVSIGGNLRDSTTDTSLYDGGALPHWCCYFDDPIDGAVVPPDPVARFLDVNGMDIVEWGRAADGTPVAMS